MLLKQIENARYVGQGSMVGIIEVPARGFGSSSSIEFTSTP